MSTKPPKCTTRLYFKKGKLHTSSQIVKNLLFNFLGKDKYSNHNGHVRKPVAFLEILLCSGRTLWRRILRHRTGIHHSDWNNCCRYYLQILCCFCHHSSISPILTCGQHPSWCLQGLHVNQFGYHRRRNHFHFHVNSTFHIYLLSDQLICVWTLFRNIYFDK